MRDHLTLSPSWYVLTTAPQKEREAVEVLNRRGYEAVRPVEAVWRRHGQKRKLSEISLTPRYVFHRCSGWPQFYNLAQINGKDGTRLITGYLSVDGMPAIIPDQVVDTLMSADTFGVTGMHRSIKPGGAIRIPHLHDAVGKLKYVQDNLARVAIVFLGELREIDIDVNKLEAA